MPLLSYDIPKKIRSTEKHNEEFSSDSGIAGTYVPNMSKNDKLKWKAKHITGNDERVEIRKTIDGVQLLIVVYKKDNPVKYDYHDKDSWNKRHRNIRISMNGKLDMTWDNLDDMNRAINEAFMKIV